MTGGDVHWRTALPLAAMAAAAALVPALLFPGALSLGGGGGLCLVLAPMAAMFAVSFYARRHPAVGARAGGRIGAVTGLLLALLVTVATGIAGFLLRYGRHSRALETTMAQSIDAAAAQFRTGTASALPAETLALLHAPEVRAGGYIAGQILIGVLILFMGALFGAFGGALRRARRQRNTRT